MCFLITKTGNDERKKTSSSSTSFWRIDPKSKKSFLGRNSVFYQIQKFIFFLTFSLYIFLIFSCDVLLLLFSLPIIQNTFLKNVFLFIFFPSSSKITWNDHNFSHCTLEKQKLKCIGPICTILICSNSKSHSLNY